VRRNATIDWTQKESARARLGVMVKRILRQNGYPPDKETKATETVLEQAVQLGLEFVEAAPAEVLPFRIVPTEEVRPFENAIPLYSLKAAAGGFSGPQVP
jgi:type I restriction enzyme R subunit